MYTHVFGFSVLVYYTTKCLNLIKQHARAYEYLFCVHIAVTTYNIIFYTVCGCHLYTYVYLKYYFVSSKRRYSTRSVDNYQILKKRNRMRRLHENNQLYFDGTHTIDIAFYVIAFQR